MIPHSKARIQTGKMSIIAYVAEKIKRSRRHLDEVKRLRQRRFRGDLERLSQSLKLTGIPSI